jgi:cytochrome b
MRVNETPPLEASAPRSGSATSTTRVLVWDFPIRFVHWAIVLLLIGLITTGKLGADWLIWHMRMGYTVIALVVFRVIWGFVGSRNARFSAFLSGPSRVLRYVRSLRGAHEVHASHNPAGGWMVLLLLVALLAQATMGLFTNDDILWGGPFSERVSKSTSDAISAIHRRFWWVIVALSALHVAAVLTYLAVKKDDLITPMLTGYKHLPHGVASSADAAASVAKGLLLLTLCGLAVWYLATRI